MIVKPHPAAVEATPLAAREAAIPAMSAAMFSSNSAGARNTFSVPARRPSRLRLAPAALMAVLLAMGVMPVRDAHAQAAAPQAADAPPRDFDAERKAIADSRAWTNYRFAKQERDCYDTYFVNHCLDKAKETQREELAVLRKRELEVGDAERAYKAAKRDREQALRQAEFEASQPGRAANEAASREAFERKQQDQQLRDAQRAAEAPGRAANAQSYKEKQAGFDKRMNEAKQKGAEQARQHQENAKAYEQKQRDAAQRQKDVEERRAKAKEQQGSASAPRPFGF